MSEHRAKKKPDPIELGNAKPEFRAKLVGRAHEDRGPARDGEEVEAAEKARDDMVLRSAAFKKAFGYDADSVLSERFASNLLESTKNKWAYDRSVSADQLSNTDFYGKVRQSELKGIGSNGYIAEQYGLKTARNKERLDQQSGLRFGNESSTDYNRDIPDQKVNIVCKALFKAKMGKDAPRLIAFVNSESAMEKFGFFFDKEKGDWQTQKLSHGVVAVTPTDQFTNRVTDQFDQADELTKFEKKTQLLGGTPSVFEAIKQKSQAEATSNPAIQGAAQPGAEKPDNQALLGAMTGEGNKAVATLKEVPDQHAMKAVANATVAMVTSLEKLLKDKAVTAEFKEEPLIANALKAMQSVLSAMPTMLQDSAGCLNAYEAMIDEMYIVLASAKPYGGDAFKQAAGASLNRRAPVLQNSFSKDVEASSYLVASGMDAITTGWKAAGQIAGGGKADPLTGPTTPEYFEVGSVFSDSGLGGGKNVLTAVLNPSTPQGTKDDNAKAWDAAKLIAEITKRLEAAKQESLPGPLVLLLDVTVEKGKEDGSSDLNDVLSALKEPIEDGSLKMILAKSYQKYPSLGSGKIMAGSVTVVAKKGDKNTDEAVADLSKTEQDLAWMENDEAQLLTHFVAEGGKGELEMGKNASDNAKLAMHLCMGKEAQVKYNPGLPFMLAAIPPEVDKGGDMLKRLLSGMGSDHRDSFGFLSTSHLLVPFDVVKEEYGQRITPGQDSQGEVVEKLWSVGHCALDKDVAKKVQKLDLDGAGEIADRGAAVIGAAADDVGKKADLLSWSKAAISVLKRRMDKLPEGIEHAIEDLELARKGQAKEKRKPSGAEIEFETGLRKQLQEHLDATKANAANPVGDQLELIGSGFAKSSGDVATSDDNVELMRARMHQPTWKGQGKPDPNAEFAPNIVASCLNLIAAAYSSKLAQLSGQNLDKVTALFDAAFLTRLEGMSPSARTKVVTAWAKTQEVKLTDPQTSEDACDDLSDKATMLPRREDKAKLLKNSVPDATVGKMSKKIDSLGQEIVALEVRIKDGKLGSDSEESEQLAEKQKEKSSYDAKMDKIIRAMFKPLDMTSKINLIKDLTTRKQYAKASACFKAFLSEIENAMAGRSELVQPERLTGGSRGGSAPQPMGPAEIKTIRSELEAVGKNLETLRNQPPVQAQPQPLPPQQVGQPQQQTANTGVVETVVTGLQNLMMSLGGLFSLKRS